MPLIPANTDTNAGQVEGHTREDGSLSVSTFTSQWRRSISTIAQFEGLDCAKQFGRTNVSERQDARCAVYPRFYEAGPANQLSLIQLPHCAVAGVALLYRSNTISTAPCPTASVVLDVEGKLFLCSLGRS